MRNQTVACCLGLVAMFVAQHGVAATSGAQPPVTHDACSVSGWCTFATPPPLVVHDEYPASGPWWLDSQGPVPANHPNGWGIVGKYGTQRWNVRLKPRTDGSYSGAMVLIGVPGLAVTTVHARIANGSISGSILDKQGHTRVDFVGSISKGSVQGRFNTPEGDTGAWSMYLPRAWPTAQPAPLPKPTARHVQTAPQSTPTASRALAPQEIRSRKELYAFFRDRWRPRLPIEAVRITGGNPREPRMWYEVKFSVAAATPSSESATPPTPKDVTQAFVAANADLFGLDPGVELHYDSASTWGRAGAVGYVPYVEGLHLEGSQFVFTLDADGRIKSLKGPWLRLPQELFDALKKPTLSKERVIKIAQEDQKKRGFQTVFQPCRADKSATISAPYVVWTVLCPLWMYRINALDGAILNDHMLVETVAPAPPAKRPVEDRKQRPKLLR